MIEKVIRISVNFALPFLQCEEPSAMLEKPGSCSYSAGMADTPNLDDLAKRYLDLWQEQLRVMAADPETIASVSRLFEAMSGAAAADEKSGAGGGTPPMPANPMAWLTGLGMIPPQAAQAASGGANPFDSVFAQFIRHNAQGPGGPASAGASSDGGGGELYELKRRLAALEERLDAVESGAGGDGKPAAKKTRKRKP
jgi:hypothetical protein